MKTAQQRHLEACLRADEVEARLKIARAECQKSYKDDSPSWERYSSSNPKMLEVGYFNMLAMMNPDTNWEPRWDEEFSKAAFGYFVFNGAFNVKGNTKEAWLIEGGAERIGQYLTRTVPDDRF